jgi:Tfp pilus assembly protein PilF
MAKAIGLNVQFHRIYVDEVWNRSGKLYFATGHVNVTLNEKQSAVALDIRRPMPIDFVTSNELKHYATEVVDEETIIAMYMNNRAAEALASGQLDNAYWWTHAAIKQAPSLEISYNTLGVIYRMHGNPVEAERAFRHALDLHSKDVIVMSNLAQTLASLGRTEEAQAMERKVEQLRPYPPFYYFNKGLAAMQAGDFKQAKAQFRRELERTPDYHEFQYWYAMACLSLGETKEAERYISLAMENSTTRKDRDIYAAKLDRIKSYATNPAHPS